MLKKNMYHIPSRNTDFIRVEDLYKKRRNYQKSKINCLKILAPKTCCACLSNKYSIYFVK